MDPNETLRRMRELAATIHRRADLGSSVTEEAQELAALVDAMDEWIERGGFLPSAWVRS